MADLVFSHIEVRAADVVAALYGVSLSAVRMMLRRLEAKGVVCRRRVGLIDYYSPAEQEGRQLEIQLQRLTNEHFNGSLFGATLKMIEMLEAREPGRVVEIAQRYRWPSAVAGRATAS